MQFNSVRFTNGLLFILVIFLTLSGIYGLFWTYQEWMFTLHRVFGWALLALLPWKGVIIYRSLQRKISSNNNKRIITGWVGISLFLAILTVFVLSLGIFWKGRFGPSDYPFRQTAISWHWMLSLGLLLPFVFHVWRRWPRPRQVDFFSRRGFLRTALVSPLAILGYLAYQQLALERQHPQEPFRYTGSRQAGWFSGNDFPLTHTQAPDPNQIAVQNWLLEITGAVVKPIQLDYHNLTQYPKTDLDAIIDCTLGWYARQIWSGVMLLDLLEQAGLERPPTGVQLVSATGYQKFLPWGEAQHILLATHVGGELLSTGHGYPLRAVVPSRRGWFWVKWLTRVEVLRRFY